MDHDIEAESHEGGVFLRCGGSPVLYFSHEKWKAFIAAAKNGEFDFR